MTSGAQVNLISAEKSTAEASCECLTVSQAALEVRPAGTGRQWRGTNGLCRLYAGPLVSRLHGPGGYTGMNGC